VAAGGAFVVVWESPDGSQEGVFGRRYDASGNSQGVEFRVNSATTNEQSHASVAMGANGSFLVVWESYQGGAFSDVFGRRYDVAGNALGTEFRVNSYTPGFQYSPSVASDASGDFVVAWASSPGGYGAPSYVFGQRYDGNGAPLGAEFTVSSNNGSPPSVASDAAGNFVVVWHVWGGYGSDDVYGRRFDNTGAPLGPQFRVNTYDYNYQQLPSVASDSDGNFVVAWASRDQDGDVDGIFGQRYDSGGVAQGEEFQISTYTTDTQSGPSISATGANQFTVVWTSDGQDGSGKGVFGQGFDFAGDAITVVSPNTDVKWRIGSLEKIQWTHNLGHRAAFRIELDRDDDGDYEELIAAAAPADGTRGSYAWTVTGPPSGAARIRVSWADDRGVSDASDGTFQIRPAG
jgi:hypothetical protein